ncbi:MAG: adenylate/guanylate cyclase domain-containing protein [Flavobacteriales bacterium]|nr:adenylate/guanylate cyclase domain-containing protein [Flavobacteriales bacterium]
MSIEAQWDFKHVLEEIAITPDSAITNSPKQALPFRYKEGLRKNISCLGRPENLDINQVMSLSMDSRSNIWMGGYNGEIIRFDGYRFHSYTLAPLFAHPIEDILEDSKGNIWFGSRAGGIVKFDGKLFHYYGPQNGFMFKIFSFTEDPNGVVWCCTNGDGLIGIKDNHFCAITEEKGLRNNAITTLSISNNEFWIGYFRDGLSHVKDGIIDTASYFGISDSTIFCMLEQPDGLIVGTRRGLSFLQKGSNEFINLYTGIGFLDICKGRNNEIICGSNGQGIFILKKNEGVGLPYTIHDIISTSDGLSSDRITNLFYDKEGNTWIGTYDFGLNLLRPQLYENFNEENGLIGNRIWSLSKSNGEVLAGYSSGGHARLNAGEDKISVIENLVKGTLQDVVSTEIFIAADGSTWYSAGRLGVYRKVLNKLVFFPFSYVKNTQGVKAMQEDQNGKMLFASWNGLLEIRDDSLKHVEFANGTILNNLNDVKKDRDDNIWIASDAGVIVIPAINQGDYKSRTYLRIGERISQGGLSCQSILPIEDEIWVGSDGGGIIVFKASDGLLDESAKIKYEIIATKEGLPDLFIMALFYDNSNVWAGTKKGICKLEKRGTNGSGWLWTIHSREEGLLEDDVVFNNVISDTFDRIWWCTNNSLAVFFPDRYVADSSAPLVSIDDILLFFEDVNWNKNVDQGGDFRIRRDESYFGSLLSDYIYYSGLSAWNFLPEKPCFSHDQNHLTFHFSARDWHDPSSIMYFVKLQGMDETWIELGNTTHITYSSLAPGKYSFEVKAINSTQQVSEVVAYSFIVQPPYWQTPWFLCLIGFLILLTFYLIYRWRIRKLEKERDILELKVEERTEQLNEEKNKSENLLLNILPKDTVNELKEYGRSDARNYEEATVLFSDFSGFTAMTTFMEPQQLVDILDTFFNAFDEVADKYCIEKIKTIGDSYMCASGIPKRSKSHALRMAAFALEMANITEQINDQRVTDGQTQWPIRIGIHSGPIIAGVVGKKKFAYDIWGDTVNTASRMEGNGEPGRINTSLSTALQLKDYFYIAPRGKMQVKGKGEMEMFWIESFKTPYRADGNKRIPNETFMKAIEELQLED